MKKLIEENPAKASGALVAVAVAIVAYVVFGGVGYNTLIFQEMSYQTVVNVLTPIFLIALLVERAVEVFVGTGRKIGRSELDSALQKASDKIAQVKERLDLLQAQLDAPGAEKLDDPQRADIEVRRINATQNILPLAQRHERGAKAAVEKYRTKTGRLTFFSGAGIGLIIGLVGIRVLAPLANLEKTAWGDFQLFLFHSLDVILTAGLLAGGASGIHKVLSTFSEFTEKSRRANKSG